MADAKTLTAADPQHAREVQDTFVERAREPGPRHGRPDSQKASGVMFAEFSGPLPPPQMLRSYQSILPDMPERLLKSWEAEVEHRRMLEKTQQAADIRAQDTDSKTERNRVVFAFVVALSGVGGSVALGVFGSPVAASLVGSGSLAVMVGSFLRRRRQQTDVQE